MQDTTTQAMTELALGLSMAFFSIMILTLLSMNQPLEQQSKKLIIEQVVDVKTTKSGKVNNQTQVVFYFNEMFFQRSLQQIKIEQFDSERQLIVAVDPNLSFAQVAKLNRRINHPMLSITTLNDEWLQVLQQKQLEKIQ